MYQDVFDDRKQTEMRNYFQNELAKLGVIKMYKKKNFIDMHCCNSSFAIVLKGKVVKSIVSSQGHEKQLYTLRPGEIFGEMNLLGSGSLNYISRVKEDAQISYISKAILDRVVEKNPSVYEYLIHSITRKFRIVLLQSTNNTFNDSRGRIAEALIRLTACSNHTDAEENTFRISTVFAQNELAHNVGCSRVTVTRVLKKFLQDNLISIKNKKIVINDMDTLVSYTDRIQ